MPSEPELLGYLPTGRRGEDEKGRAAPTL